MIYRLGELFSGPGGLALGAKNAKTTNGKELFAVDHVWANDIDEDSCHTFRKNIVPSCPKKVIHSPVKDLKISLLPKIDAFAYGFPCNDFSIVGEHLGIDGTFGPLYMYGVKVLNFHNPMWFLAENVGGIANANEGEAFKKILEDLSKAGRFGYKLSVHKYKFEEYGIPQKRHRIVIVGIRKNLDVHFLPPAPITPRLDQQLSAKDAITNPPIPEDAFNNELTNHPKIVRERLKAIPAGENVWWDGLPKHLRLNVKGAKLSQIYRRLSPNKPSYTITGSGGGGTHGYHWEYPRALTNRERARLQTFPDWFKFHGGKESVRKQIGMAVPSKGAEQIITAVLKSFAGIPYESVSPNWNSTSSKNSFGGKQLNSYRTK